MSPSGRRFAGAAAIAGLAAVLVLGLAWWPRPGPAAGARVVTVGLYENAPKVYTGPDGQPAGLFVELLAAIARAEGWQLRYVPCEWAQCLDQLAAGELALMPDVAYSEERSRRFDFHAVSVASSWSQIYSRADVPVQSWPTCPARLAGCAAAEGGVARMMAEAASTSRCPSAAQ
jgi:ABC-type amino acid transport substrate-binding protein